MQSGGPRIAASGLTDVWRAVTSWPLWISLGLNDVRDRYSRSRIGVIWVPVLTGVFVAVLSFVFGRLNEADIAGFTLYVASGYILWQFFSEVMIDGANLFNQSEAMLWNSTQPRSLFLFRNLTKQIYMLALNAIVLVAVFIVFEIAVPVEAFLILVTLPILVLVAPGVVLLISLLALRFPDARILLTFAIRLMFFATPIMWTPERLGTHAWVTKLNPFYHAIELVRAPLMGQFPSNENLAVVLVVGVVTSVLALALYRHWYRRFIYWI